MIELHPQNKIKDLVKIEKRPHDKRFDLNQNYRIKHNHSLVFKYVILNIKRILVRLFYVIYKGWIFFRPVSTLIFIKDTTFRKK